MSAISNNLKNSYNEKIIILGAGPGGLMNALRLVEQGCTPIILEKRASSSALRDNSVILNNKSISLLEKEGIYQSLLRQKKIFPCKDEITVRLGDLEAALKSKLSELSTQPPIHYQRQVVQIEEKNGKSALVLENGDKIEDIDIVINAEGANSSTNALLGNQRKQVLSKVPVIATIYKDTRPSIKGPCTLLKYIGITLVYAAKSIYYYAIYFFKLVFQREFFLFSKRKIAGAIILKTPHQNYLGLGLNKDKSDQLGGLQWWVKFLKETLREETDPVEIKQLQKDLKQAEKELRSFVEFWSNIAFCEVNIAAFISLLMRARDSRFCFARRLAFDKFSITEIGADRAEHSYIEKGNTIFLNIGDALATVDPTTGLGCNTALASAQHVEDFVKQWRENPQQACLQYFNKVEDTIASIHLSSKALRAIYRPDALHS